MIRTHSIRGSCIAIVASLWICPAAAQQAPMGVFATAAERAVASASTGFADRSSLARIYTGNAAHPLWTAQGRPTRQALAMIGILGSAASRGLDPRDYDASALAASAALLDASTDSAQLARFDVALSRSVVQFLGDLHDGRANPRLLGFHLPDSHRDLDLAALAISASAAPDPATVISSAEPAYVGYRRLEIALARYRQLAADTSLRPPAPARVALHVGGSYADAASLRQLLLAFGDLSPAASSADTEPTGRYTAALSIAVAEFQRRNGLAVDGIAGPATMRALRVPIAQRVRQIELTLERWRWLPDVVPDRYAVVNIPGFRLYVFENDPTAAHPELRMNVIVGRATGRRATPIFTSTMREVVIRPYWDVPPSIARNEIIPATRRNWSYFDRENLEIVRGGDFDAVVYPLTGSNLNQVLAGALRIRQRPGPGNSLGLVKFVFPNEYNVYMHGTPAQSLFAESRRDFSHGCIRVEHPLTLAELVLRGQDGWNRESIDSAMSATGTLRIPIARPIAVYILYQTVVVGSDGTVYFYNDLYGHDAALARTLERLRASGVNQYQTSTGS